MGILKIFSNNKDGKLKRAELKVHSKDSKVRVRASRTGGVNAAYHPVRGITFNTKYGMRASKTFKGLTLGFQGGNSIVRGRWSSKGGLLNANLSKSGLSFSTKTKHSTYNWTNPNRSSVNFAGIQIRGKKAKDLAAGLLMYEIMWGLISFIFRLCFSILEFVVPILFQIILFVGSVVVRLVISIMYLLLYLIIDLPKQVFSLATEKTKNTTSIKDKNSNP